MFKMQAPNSISILRKSTLVTSDDSVVGGGGITLAGVTLYSRIMVCVCVCVCVCELLHVVVKVRKHFSAKMTSELELNLER